MTTINSSKTDASDLGDHDDHVEVLVEDLFIEDYDEPLTLALSDDDDDEEAWIAQEEQRDTLANPLTKKGGGVGRVFKSLFVALAVAALASGAWFVAEGTRTRKRNRTWKRFWARNRGFARWGFAG